MSKAENRKQRLLMIIKLAHGLYKHLRKVKIEPNKKNSIPASPNTCNYILK
jgi:hypothetical protein